MSAAVLVPVDFLESVAALRLPAKADARLQRLMDRNTNGDLPVDGRAELESLVELSEPFSLIRARALHLLGRGLA